MADPIQKPDENIVIRTMKGDLQKLSGITIKEEKKPEIIPAPPIAPISQESQVKIPTTITETKLEPKPPVPLAGKPPVLVIPPKKIAEIPTAPLFKATPVWLKIVAIGLGIIIIVLAGLYGYWKIFIQNQPTPSAPSIATTTIPILPTIPTATTTAPIKFFNKLPNKEVTIDISSKTSASLLNALKSEMAIEEARASVKQIKLTYKGKPITTEEFFNLMSIFAPKDFLKNYEDEFVFAFFSQKEGARPILILKTKNKSLAENQMKDWEANKFPSDILPLFISNPKFSNNLPAFKSYLFIGQPVRYLNINLPFTSLNYAIYNNFLIFTTSSAGMFVILQDLTGQNVSIDYKNSLEASINNFVK